VTLRPATPGDALGIATLEKELFGVGGWSLSSVRSELGGMDRFAVVATGQVHLLGYATTMRSGDVVDLHRIGVHPAHQRKGLACSLLTAVIDEARAHGADRMLLEVSSRNLAALALYTKNGFVEIDTRRRYYGDDDALVLVRTLTEGREGP